jgi:1-acyl-sn-glycerol-3-phosphate acyltransferase
MYAILKILCRLTIRAFFRKVKIEGKENIQGPGPFIFISNHPSAFMDPVVVATSIKPSVHFLAAGEYMGKGFKYWFMKNFLHMIPVYRPETMPDKAHQNEAVFSKCIEHLNKNKCILVFPEGVSETEKKIKPLKTGVSGIVRATEVANDMQANIQIVPIGLNYSDPHKFRSDLLVNIGNPIKASDYLTTNDENEVSEVKELTQVMEDALIQTVLHVENMELEELLDKINSTYARDLKKEMGVGFDEQQKEFELNKLTINAITYFKNHQPDQFITMQGEIDAYITELANIGCTDKEFRKVDVKTTFLERLFLLWGTPLFLIGLLGNILPHQITTIIQKKLDVKGTFRGSIIFAIGLVIFSLWYIGVVCAIWLMTPLSYFSLLAPVLLYLTGLHALVYQTAFHYLSHRKRLRKFFADHPELKASLFNRRNDLMEKFTTFRSAFDNRIEA